MRGNRASFCIVVALAAAACQEVTFDSSAGDGLAPRFATSAATVTLQDLGTFGATNAVGHGINDQGVVVGEAFGPGQPSRAFRWSARAGSTDLGTLGGPAAAAFGVNDRGDVAGVSMRMAGNVPPNAFLWTERDGMIDLLPDLPPRTEARAINNRGAVAGTIGSLALVDHVARAFLWTKQDGVTETGNLPGGTAAVAQAVNDLGQVAGVATGGPGNTEIRGFVWSAKDGMRDIGFVGPLPSGNVSLRINNRGHVGGVLNTADGPRGFLWTPQGGMLEIHPPGALRSFVNAINDRGQLVGGFVSSLGPQVLHAFLWSAQTGYVVLPELAADNTAAFAINNAGEIAGRSRAPDGNMHAVVWSLR